MFEIKELSLDQVNTILAALGKLPLEASLTTFNAVRSQVEQQMQAQQADQPLE